MALLRPDLQAIPPYRLPAEPEGLVPLHLSRAPEDWPSEAKKALLARLRDLPFNLDPERQAVLTERLRQRLGAPKGGLLLGPSTDALLDLVALAGLAPGEEVAVPELGLSLYPLLVQRQGGRPRSIPIGAGFPLEPWFGALDCRQLWLTLPNPPTGAWVGPEELEPLLQAAAAQVNPPLVVLDEACAEFAPFTHRLTVDRFPNLLLLRTFSKALTSASWRLGYLLGDPALIGRLASIQRPQSVPAASLEALDVALDFAPAFEARTRDLTSGRAPSLPGSPNSSTLPRRRLLALDVDGVLIDAERSFMEAVRLALAELMPDTPWTDEHFRAFKRAGGFNNDFRLTAAAWALAEAGQLARIFVPEGSGFPELEARFAALEPKAQRVVQRHYAETCKLERALIELPELEATGLDLAILTGRPPKELAMAFQVLGWRLPAVSDSGPHLRKPEPAGLLQLADAFRAEEIIFVGDTRDDAAALRGARAIRPELTWTFAAVGPDRARFAHPEDLQSPTLRDLLPMLKA